MPGFKTLADIEALEKTPLSARNLPPTTYQMLQQGAAINPQRIALSFFLQGADYARPTQYTYQHLMNAVNQTANMLNALGVEKNDVVSMVLPNLPQSFFSIWGGEAAGIVNPINPLLEAEQIADIMNAAGTKALVTLGPFPKTNIWQKVSAIADKVPTLETILQVDMSRFLPPIKRLIVKWMARKLKGSPVKAQVLDFDATMQKYPADKLSNGRVIQRDDIASYFHTGGTTGMPKLAQHTHFNEVFDAWSGLQTLPVTQDTIMFCGLPLFHVNAVIVTGLIPWSQGAGVVLGTPAGYRGEGVLPNFWKIIEHYKLNYFSGVPTVYSTLLNVPVDNADISSLEFAICGAAPMPVEVFNAFEERSGVRILEGYGLTEGTCISSVNPAYGERRVGSIGLRLPYQEMKTICLDAEGNYLRNCKADEIGVVAIRGHNVFPGYKDQRANKGIWIKAGDGAPWLNTGDMGRMDAKGYFWLTGRRKELIIRGGHNIDPKLIEDPLHKHPAVALAAAVGRPDPRVGELPVAYVQLKPERSVTEEELLQYAKETIGERAAIPKKIRIVESIPITAVGKIFKPALVRREISDVYQQEISALEGLAGVNVTVDADKTHGTLAHITVQPAAGADKPALEESIRRALGRYTIRYELKMEEKMEE
ncbi:MAG TPA: acyl-CoA synthetase [Anaerolineae bacterium]|nr:acyl-CoA synthetase [Anaerolineae bacterium]